MEARMPDTTRKVHKEILPNGLVVLTEPMEHVHSVMSFHVVKRCVFPRML